MQKARMRPPFMDALRKSPLQRRMTAMLLAFVLLSMLFTGLIILIGSIYLSGFNAILNDCYSINELLVCYTKEAADFQTYMLYGGEGAYAEYLASRADSNRALERIDIPYARSHDQYLLLQAIATSFESFRAACGETVFKRMARTEYADLYDRALRIGQYIESYIKQLLQEAITHGQQTYQQNQLRFRLFPALFLLSLGLSFLCIMLWTRWMVRHVVTPINDLIQVAGDMSDVPHLPGLEPGADEIDHLTRVVHEMKDSTRMLVDSLRERQEMEARLHTEEMRRVTMENTMDTLRLSLLQSQINPHFLFNTLNIISRMAKIEDAPTTEELIVRLANLFRYNLRSGESLVSLASELKIVEDYIAIQQIRFGERVSFVLSCDLDPAAYTVPVFMLQPLIENAVIHGISPMEEGGVISIEIRREEGLLHIAVRDTGIGMSPEKLQSLLEGRQGTPKHVSGLGLGNVRGRVEAFRPGSRFSIRSSPGEGTCVCIEIPEEEEKP